SRIENEDTASIGTQSEQIVNEITAILCRTAARTHLNIFVDDVDCADKVTVSVLEKLLLNSPPLTLVVTQRHSSAPTKFTLLTTQFFRPRPLRLTLGPLNLDEVRKLLSYYVRQPEDEILNRINGNPLLLHEYASHGLNTEELSSDLDQRFHYVLNNLTTRSL